MHKNTWKAFERRVAKFFGTTRTALSGGNGKITRSDSLHDTLYIECKHTKRNAAITLWDDTKAKADKEGKIPVVCLGVKGRKGFWALVKMDDLTAVANQRIKARQ